jgi:hypothetical protein
VFENLEITIERSNAMKKTVLLLIVLMIASCATGSTSKHYRLQAEVEEENCGPETQLKEQDVRMILYQARKQWDSIHKHVMSRQTGESQSKEAIDFTVQNREFTKYYNNALMLYLRGDTSSDLRLSLITLKHLISLAETCYPEIREDISYVQALNDACSTITPFEDDARRMFLYRAKTEWDEHAVLLLGLRMRGSLTEEKQQRYETLDREFTDNYNNACMLYFSGETESDDFTRLINTLDEINSRTKDLIR